MGSPRGLPESWRFLLSREATLYKNVQYNNPYCLYSVEISCAALSGPGAEAVSTATGPQWGFYRWNWLLQSLSHGCQLSAGWFCSLNPPNVPKQNTKTTKYKNPYLWIKWSEICALNWETRIAANLLIYSTSNNHLYFVSSFTTGRMCLVSTSTLVFCSLNSSSSMGATSTTWKQASG